MYGTVFVLCVLFTSVLSENYDRYAESTSRYNYASTIATLFNQNPYKTFNNDVASIPVEATRYPNYNPSYSTSRYGSAYSSPGYAGSSYNNVGYGSNSYNNVGYGSSTYNTGLNSGMTNGQYGSNGGMTNGQYGSNGGITNGQYGSNSGMTNGQYGSNGGLYNNQYGSNGGLYKTPRYGESYSTQNYGSSYGYSTPRYGEGYSNYPRQGYTSYERPLIGSMGEYCQSRSPQNGIYVDNLMGMWYGVEFIQHLGGNPGVEYSWSCIVIHIAEPAPQDPLLCMDIAVDPDV